MRTEMKVAKIEHQETVTLTDGKDSIRIIPDYCGQFALDQTVPVELSPVPSVNWKVSKILV